MDCHPRIERAVRVTQGYLDYYKEEERKKRMKLEHLFSFSIAAMILDSLYEIYIDAYSELLSNVLLSLIIGITLYRFNKVRRNTKEYISKYQQLISWLETQEVYEEEEVTTALKTFGGNVISLTDEYSAESKEEKRAIF